MLVEHARNLIGIADATHAEYGADGTPIVTLLACSLDGKTIDIDLTPGSRLATLYGAPHWTETTTCNYGLEPTFAGIANEAGMIVSAIDASGEVRAVERTDHPFFIATLYQPQLSSAADSPHPVWSAFVSSVNGQTQ